MLYRAGLPGWKLIARAGGKIVVNVNVIKDEDAGVYVATSANLRGLVVEAETLDKLNEEIHIAVSELLTREFASGAPPRARTEMRFAEDNLCAA